MTVFRSMFFAVIVFSFTHIAWADWTTCQTYSRGVPYSYGSQDANYARQMAYSNCRNAFGSDAWECERNLTCDYYNGYPSQPTTTCTTQSRGYPFSRSSTDGNWAFQQVINDCTSNAWTDNWECRNNARCVANGGATPPPYNPYPPAPPGEYCPTPGRPVNQCTTRTSGGMAYTGRIPMDAIRSCLSGENVRPQGRAWECTCYNTTCN